MKNYWRSLLRWTGLATVVLQIGCTGTGTELLTRRTAVPGGGGYCINTKSTREFRESLKTSYVGYGPYQRGVVAGDSSICGLEYFHVYTVSWETKDGRKEQYEFDLAKLMRKLQDEKPVVLTLTKHASQPDLLVEYKPGEINISYKVFQYQVDGMEERNGRQVLIKPTIDTQFPLLTVPLTSPIAAPAVK
jgi:uncharacterized protein YcfL